MTPIQRALMFAPPLLGADVLTNGDFEGGATGWTVTGNDGTHVATFAGGTLRFQSDTTSPQLIVAQNSLTSGRRYEMFAEVSSWTSGTAKIEHTTGTILLNRAGTFRMYITASSISFSITRSTTNVDLTIERVWARPVLRG
jgi:hypothetical protein